MKRILHVGCGGSFLPPWLMPAEEIRLDIDERHDPDIVASILDMGDIGGYDAVYSSHTLEHVAWHETAIALSEMYRVLKPGGVVIIRVPNLENVKATEDVLYESAVGPITGLDMIYGHRGLTAENPYMAHKCGFTPATLEARMREAGFADVGARALAVWDLIAVGRK